MIIAIILLALGELYLLWLHVSTCKLMSKMLRELGDMLKEGDLDERKTESKKV